MRHGAHAHLFDEVIIKFACYKYLYHTPINVRSDEACSEKLNKDGLKIRMKCTSVPTIIVFSLSRSKPETETLPTFATYKEGILDRAQARNKLSFLVILCDYRSCRLSILRHSKLNSRSEENVECVSENANIR